VALVVLIGLSHYLIIPLRMSNLDWIVALLVHLITNWQLMESTKPNGPKDIRFVRSEGKILWIGGQLDFHMATQASAITFFEAHPDKLTKNGMGFIQFFISVFAAANDYQFR